MENVSDDNLVVLPPPDNESQVTEEVVEESPTREANGDDLSDLFKVPKQTDRDMDTSDLLNVDIDRDVVDAGEDGTLDDITRVSEEDVMGRKPVHSRRPGQQRFKRTTRRYPPPTSMGGMRY